MRNEDFRIRSSFLNSESYSISGTLPGTGMEEKSKLFAHWLKGKNPQMTSQSKLKKEEEVEEESEFNRCWQQCRQT